MHFVSVGKNKKACVKTWEKLFSKGLYIVLLTEIGFFKNYLFYESNTCISFKSQKVLKGLETFLNNSLSTTPYSFQSPSLEATILFY